MIFPSEPGRHRTPDELQSELQDALVGSPRLACSDLLLTAKMMLEAQILSRRAMIADLELDQEQVNRVSREIGMRVARIRLIVDELRSRGEAVEWEE